MALPAVAAAIAAFANSVGGLFKSKKHYTLFYWESADSTWKFVFNGHPSQVNPMATQLAASGIPTKIVRDKTGTAPAPKDPPAGYSATPAKAASTNTIMIIAVAAAVAFALFMILRKRKK